MTEIRELLGWLKCPEIPIGSTLIISDIHKMYFYSKVPDKARDKVVSAAIQNLASEGYITVNNNTIVKQDFIDY